MEVAAGKARKRFRVQLAALEERRAALLSELAEQG
jgi:hypothetical protein